MARMRTVVRRLQVDVEFHQVDMLRVVHNAAYFTWFEKGRLQLLEEFFPVSWALENRVVTPVVMNRAEYLNPATYGDRLVVSTRHRIVESWNGRLLFEHAISNAKTKVELCVGETAVTVLDLGTGHLLKEIPEAIWKSYQALR